MSKKSEEDRTIAEPGRISVATESDLVPMVWGGCAAACAPIVRCRDHEDPLVGLALRGDSQGDGNAGSDVDGRMGASGSPLLGKGGRLTSTSSGRI